MQLLTESKKYFGFNLTDEQAGLVYKLMQFLDSRGEIFILKGYAGTGKTSLVRGVIKYLSEQKRPYILLASTGRAAKILSDKTQHPVATIHSYIYKLRADGLQEISDKDHFSIIFNLKVNHDPEECVYFIDEASMISDHAIYSKNLKFGSGRLLSDLLSFAGSRKLVFIGDPVQLPPINTRFSAALNYRYLTDKLMKKVEESELKKIMRYESRSAIGINTVRIRHAVNSGRYPYLSVKARNLADSFVYRYLQTMVSEYTKSIQKTGIDNNIFLVYSNKKAAIINHSVRSLLFGKKSLIPLNKGEALMVVRNNYLYNVLNGDLVYFDEKEQSVHMAGMEFIRVKLRLNSAGEGARMIQAYLIKDLLISNDRDLTYEQENELRKDYFIRLSHIADEIYTAFVSSGFRKNKAPSIISEIRRKLNYNIAIPEKIQSGQLSKTKLRKELIAANLMTDPFLNALRVKYGYAITCHKAQGGEWNEVFILLEPALFYNDKETQYRWAYTALSRSVKRVHFLDNRCIY